MSKSTTKEYLNALDKKRKLTNVNKEYGKLGEKGKLYNYPLIDDNNNYITVNSSNIRLYRFISQTGIIIRTLFSSKRVKESLQNQIINTVKQIGDYMSVCTLPDIIRQLEILDSDDTLMSPLPLAHHPEYTFHNVFIQGGKQTYRYTYSVDVIPDEHYSKETFKFDYIKLNEKIRNPYYRKDIINVPVRDRQTEVSERLKKH